LEIELLAIWEEKATAEHAEIAEQEVSLRAARSPRLKKTVVFVTHDLEEAISLADEVVVLSAGPAAHVVAQHAVTLDRPRDLMELRTLPAFVDMYRAIWAVLREEVIKSQRVAEAPRG
jgi:ABC-type nitrate/sulfonate/bicarbonate transport system ATPase subunit